MVTLPDCSICCEPLASNLGSLKCGHVFHSECILQWLAERQVCPLCKQSVHRSQIRNLFYTITSTSDAQSSQLISVPCSDDSNFLIVKLTTEIGEYRSKLSECREQLKEKDEAISLLNGKNRVLELDQNRHIADIHNFKIKIGTLTKESQDQISEYKNQIQKLERKLVELRNDEAMKRAIEEQNKDGTCDISAIKKRCKTMSTDTKIKFLLQQLEYTNDLYSQLQQRGNALEKELNQSRNRISALQALGQNRRNEGDYNRLNRRKWRAENEEVIVLDGSNEDEPETESYNKGMALPLSTSSSKLLPKPSSNRTSFRISTGNQQAVSVSLAKPDRPKRPLPKSIAGVSVLAQERHDRGPTGTGGTSSTLSTISSSLMKNRFRSSTKINSAMMSQDIRTAFKRKYPGM